jgi:hypothetical protein
MLGRIVKRLLHRLVRGVITRPIRFGILLVAVLAGASLLLLQSGLPALSLSMPSFRVGGGGQPEATEAYMRGTETYNAELVWKRRRPITGTEASRRRRCKAGSTRLARPA